MADKGIIFSAPMVRALLDGTKTQTRRLLKPELVSGARFSGVEPDGQWLFVKFCAYAKIRPPYAPGDRLYVREAWFSTPAYDDLSPSAMGGEEPLRYAADDATFNWAEADGAVSGRRRASMHMPRWASRITLTVTDVRVQRLQDCSEADAIAEGIEPFSGIDADCSGWRNYLDADPAPKNWLSPIDSYRTLWDSINGEGAWAANPWVVAVSFDVRRGNIDQNPPTNSDAGGDHVTRSAERANTFKPIDTGRPGNGRPTSTGQGEV